MNDGLKEKVPEHPELINVDKDWMREWVGMPEFIQPKRKEYAKIIVRFRCKDDLDEFSRIIGQKLNSQSQCTWYPELRIIKDKRMKYVSES